MLAKLQKKETVEFSGLLIALLFPWQERDAALRSELQAINDKFLGNTKKSAVFWDETGKGRLSNMRKNSGFLVVGGVSMLEDFILFIFFSVLCGCS